MTPERWKEVERVFHEALKYQPSERSRFLNETCKEDEDLRLEVEALLAQESRAENFLEMPAMRVAAELLIDNPQLTKGDQIGPYRILSFLNAGGMGEVYLARDVRLGRRVALKLLPEQFLSENDSVRRFEREARAASILNHPNLLTVFDIGETERTRFIAAEYVEGKTLRQVLREGKIEFARVLEISIQIATALVAAHGAGIVHRDLKPENIMIREDGLVKVLDFGLALLTETDSSADEDTTNISELLTETGKILGTTKYMSPEQARGWRADSRSDLFSLGVLLYEMITGEVPFSGETHVDIIANLLSLSPPPPIHIEAGVPAEIETLIEKAMRKDRNVRYQAASDLLQDLIRIQDGIRLARINTKSPLSTTKTRTRKKITAIAVLPEIASTLEAEQEYLVDGISEHIISSLSQLSGLRVMAWSTVSRYKNRRVDPRQVGEDLGVNAVLITRVIPSHELLIVKAELIDAVDGSHLWGEQYHHHLNEVTAIAGQIASKISEKLKIRLTVEEQKRLARKRSHPSEAYHAYLKGRFFWNKRTTEALWKGLGYFQQAIELDPSFASAYCGLSDSYTLLVVHQELDATGFLKAKAAAAMALKVDSSLGEARASLGHAMLHNWEWKEAEREFKHAMKLNPGYASAHHWYSEYFLVKGESTDCIREAQHAMVLDPLSLIIHSMVGEAHYFARDYDAAIAQAFETLGMDPNFSNARVLLGKCYLQKRMYDEALAQFRRVPRSDRNGFESSIHSGCIYAKTGDASRAHSLLEELRQKSENAFLFSYGIALIHVALGEMDRAFQYLEAAYETRNIDLANLKVDPCLDPIRSDARYMDLLRRTGL